MTAQDLFQEASELYAASKFDAAQCVLTRYFETGLSLEQMVEATLLRGKIFTARCDYDKARRDFCKARDIAETLSAALVAKALNLLANIDALTGNLPSALGHLQNAADIYEREKMYPDLAITFTNTGTLYHHIGDLANELECLIKAYDILKGTGTRKEAITLISLGITYTALGQFEQAEDLNREAYDLATSLGEHETTAFSLCNSAKLAFRQGLLSEAYDAFSKYLAKSREYCFIPHEVEALAGLADVLRAQSNYAEALKCLELGLTVAKAAGIIPEVFAMMERLAALTNVMGKSTMSLTYAKECLDLAKCHGGDSEMQIAHARMAEGYKALNDFKNAYFHLDASQKLEVSLLNAQSESQVAVRAVQLKTERLRSKAAIDREARVQAEQLAAVRTRELEEANIEIVSRLALAAELRDDDTGEHTRRVGRSAAILAYALGLPLSDVRDIYAAARLHDVGKIGISDTILLKPGRLTKEEFETIKTHTTVGAFLLNNGRSPLLRLAEQITLSHHERYDGTGYPHGLVGGAIPLTARIVAVADVIDALTHERPYKAAWTLDQALEEVYSGSETQFDPQVVDAARRAFGTHLFDPRDTGHGTWKCLLSQLEQTDLRPVPNVSIKKLEAEASF